MKNQKVIREMTDAVIEMRKQVEQMLEEVAQMLEENARMNQILDEWEAKRVKD